MRQPPIMKAALTLVAIGIFVNLSAQTSSIDYDLSQYKLPDLKRQYLYVDFDLNGNDNRTSSKTENLATDYESNALSNDFSFGTRINPSYTLYKNSEKHQFTQSISLGLNLLGFDQEKYHLDYFTGTSGSYSESLSRSSSNNGSLSYSGSFREFVKEKLFIEQGLYLNTSSRNQRMADEDRDSIGNAIQDATQAQNAFYLNPSLQLLVGWGRIEQVEDARLAVYILDDLNKAGLLIREVRDEDIEGLAKIISRLQNERFFDSRHKKIWELQQLDSAIQSLGLVAGEDIVYYTLMQDNWEYAASPVRESGFQIAGGLLSFADISRFVNEQDHNYYMIDSSSTARNENYQRGLDYGGIIRLRYEKPLNLFWQFSLQNDLRFYKSKDRSITQGSGQEEVQYDTDAFLTHESLSLGLNYYPNTRTSLEMFWDNSLTLNTNQTGTFPETDLALRTSLGVDAYYYFSPQLRFQLTGSTEAHFNKSLPSESDPDYRQKSNNLTGYLSAGFIYYFL